MNLLVATSNLDVKRIPLSQGQFALVDAREYPRLCRFNWHAQWNEGTGSFYAVRNVRKGETTTLVSMHRMLLDLPHGDRRVIDHENHDTLDNRRENLKVTSVRGNAENQRNQSPYGVGVRRSKSGRFECRARKNGKKQYLGTFDTPAEATAAREAFV